MSFIDSLPPDFVARMRSTLGDEWEQFAASYERPPERGVRVNTLKISVEQFKEIAPFGIESVPWCEQGFYVDCEKTGKFIAYAAGLYYSQEPSAMCAAPLLKAREGESVLDLCSAPGGKGTQLAADMSGEGVLFLNEINFNRAKILSQNVERMGVKNALVTVSSPAALAEEYEGCFDKILVDAPCSGEGMFKKEEAAITEWSLQNVEMCAKRQAEILISADKLLKVGGSMVYSTCTFSEQEDERQIENFLKTHKNYTLEKSFKLYPHKSRGEGHYAALLKKTDGIAADFKSSFKPLQKEREKIFRQFEKECLNIRFENLYGVGDVIYALPDGAPVPRLQTLRAGVKLGQIIGGRFEPDHALAMCIKMGQAKFAELDEELSREYLSGRTFECSGNLSGWCVAAYKGYPLGWVKVSSGVAKNHYPKGLRANYV